MFDAVVFLGPIDIMSYYIYKVCITIHKFYIDFYIYKVYIYNAMTSLSEPHEFCSHEVFNATCRPNEVLMIQSASYGRLRLGRCVKIGLGFLGCKANVRHIVEMRCTGRRHCSLPVADLELRMTTPCPTDVTWHLEVSYVCQKGLYA